MNNWYWVKPKFFALFGTLLAFFVMSSLGAWQLHRLEWKQAIIDKMEAAKHLSPTDLTTLSPTDWESEEFKKVAFTGRAAYSKPIHVAARYFRGQLGYHVLVPMEILDETNARNQTFRIALVNIGWIPEKDKSAYVQTPAAWQSWQRIEGGIRIANRKGWFTPHNDPAGNLWFWYDIPALEKATGRELLPIVIDRLDPQETAHAMEVTYPVGFVGDIHLRNDHLQYAVTWFGIGLCAVIMFLCAHIRRKPSSETPHKT